MTLKRTVMVCHMITNQETINLTITANQNSLLVVLSCEQFVCVSIIIFSDSTHGYLVPAVYIYIYHFLLQRKLCSLIISFVYNIIIVVVCAVIKHIMFIYITDGGLCIN